MKRARVSYDYFYNGCTANRIEEATRSRKARIIARRAQKYKSMMKSTANVGHAEKKEEENEKIEKKRNHEPTTQEEVPPPAVVVVGDAEIERPSPSEPESASALPFEWWEECPLLEMGDVFPYWEIMNPWM